MRFQQELARAERLFARKQYGRREASFERLRVASQGEDRTLVRLRMAEERLLPARATVPPPTR